MHPDGEHHIVRTFAFPDFKTALEFTNKVGGIAEEQGHHRDEKSLREVCDAQFAVARPFRPCVFQSDALRGGTPALWRRFPAILHM